MLTLYHAPWSRSSAMLWLLEELGQPYEIALTDIRMQGGLPESYRAIQPNKKVPAIDHDGTIVTERAAISIYLCEQFPQAGLAPAVGDPDRAAYLTWLVYADSVFDPVLAAKAHGTDYMGSGYSYGSFAEMTAHLDRTLSARPYIAGDRFTAADVQIASGIHYGIQVLKILPETSPLTTYLARVFARPAYKTSSGKDFDMAKAAGMVPG